MNRYCLLISLSLTPAAVLGYSGQGNAQEKGTPGTWKLHVIDDSSRGADGARLADVNADGLMDIATGWEEGGQVRICLHPGYKAVHRRWPSVTVGKVKAPEDAVFVDLDGDKKVDVVSSCEGRNNNVYIHWAPENTKEYLQEKAWKTIAFPQLKGKSQWMYSLPMQIDGKHGPDLVVGSKNRAGQIGWLQAPENPRDIEDWKYHPLRKAGWIMSLEKADMDGDGDPDVLVSDRRGKQSGCLWLENPGVGSAQTKPWKTHRIGPVGPEVMLLDHADLDGDGFKDVLVTTKERKIFFNRRTKEFPKKWETREIRYPDNMGTGKHVRVADINLDGKLDLVLACENAQRGRGIVWMSYKKSPLDFAWDVHEVTGLLGIKFDLIQLTDLDGDGDLDLINTEERVNRKGLGVVWYENPTK